MKIFLAGGVQANLKPFFRAVADLAKGGKITEEVINKSMQIFMAGGEARHWISNELYAKDESVFSRGHPLEKWDGV